MQQNGYILILAIGMVIVIISGHIDLSVGSIAGFIGAMSAVLMIQNHMPWPVAVAVCLLLGALIGAWQGFWIAYVGIPSFIVTLAGMLVFRGATQYLLDGQSIAPFPRSFSRSAVGSCPRSAAAASTIGPPSSSACWSCSRRSGSRCASEGRRPGTASTSRGRGGSAFKCAAIVAALAAFTLLLASYRGVPVVGIILAVMFVVYAFVMRSTVFGRQVYAVGGNVAAARLSGVKTKRVTFLVFVNMGLLSALAGLLFAARLNSATPQAGIGMELEAIAAAFIGGASANGGVGTVFGAIIGGFVLGVLNNGMSLIGIGSDVQQVIKGLVLLAAVGFDVYNKKKGGS